MRHAVRLSSRLSVVLQPPRHRRGRPSHVRHRQPRPSVHAGCDLRQGARVRRARSFTAACAHPAPARGSEGNGRVRADLLGRGDRRNRAALARDPGRRRRRGDPAVLLRGLDGPGPVLRGPPPLPRARDVPSRPHDLRQHRVRGLACHPGRRHRERLGADGGRGPRRPLGRERGLFDDQCDDAREAGARARRRRGRRRSVSHTHRPAGGPAPHGPPGHRRGAGARRDARPDRGGVSRPRLHPAGDARLRAARRAREGVLAGDGGMTCRTLACLPALTGAYADPHGGALLSSTAGFGFDYAVLERPDLMPAPPPRIVNMIHLGRVLTDRRLAPPIRSLYVYSSNPAAVCPNQTLVLAGLAREDLFTVVHEQVLTDTAAYADLVLPATTSMEHLDLYRSYGQFTLQLARPVLPPQGQAKSNWEAFQLLARAMGVAEAHYAKSPEALIREFLAKGDATVRGITFDELAARGWVRVNLPRPYTPFAHGAPTPSGKVEFYSERLARQGLPALPTYVPLGEGPENRELAARYPLQCLVPPNRFFLNSSFSQSALLRRRQGTPTVMMAPADATRRGIVDGAVVTVESPRGTARFTARVTDATRPGVVVIEGVWWHRFHPGGQGVNVLTSDRVTDLGDGPAFHSNLVEVSRA